MMMKKLFAGLLFLFVFPVAAEEELLEPDKAFAFQAEVVDGTVQARWDVADNYYMYRGKIRFEVDNPDISLGEPQLPDGKIKDDEFFGEVEIYRGSVPVTIPIESGSGDFTLTAHSQGCADVGVCYPPHRQNVQLTATGTTTGTDGKRSLQDLNDDLGLNQGDDEVLHPDQAFAFNTEIMDANTVRATWQIMADHYLYRDKFEFSVKQGDARVGKVELPKGKEKEDEFFGKIRVFEGEQTLVVDIPLERTRGEAGEVELAFVYQGCAEKTGICYPPIRKSETVTLAATDQFAMADDPEPAGQSAGQQQPVSEQDTIAASLQAGGLLVILTFFGFGLLLAFTPCVFPMIPILSSIIIGQGDKITTGRAFTMSTVYVLAMALTYTAAGVIAGMLGENLQAAFQNPWILGSFAAVFVLLSLSMFGFYELQMPASIQGKLSEVSNRQKGGSLTGVAVMGFLSALIVGPCVAAPLAGALIYIGQTGDAVLGGMALFALSLGMGLPLIAIGTSAGKLLPRAGGWMDTVKAIFGVLLLAVAIWMLERIIPDFVALWLWAALLIISGIYMKALEPLPADTSGWHRLWKGLGIIVLVYGILLVIGASAGSNDKFRPLHGVFAGAGMSGGAQQQSLQFEKIKTVEDFENKLAQAKAAGKPVMLDFYADWCIYCKDYEKYVFTDQRVIERLDNFVLLKADVTDNDDKDKALLRSFNLVAPPAILFFGPDGEERHGRRLVGAMNADEFHNHLNMMSF
ncbi:MAG: protein-disulfide reductase DsbD [Thiohalophilus sp.]|uniref:protein-disulfide reductase DsbD n=1 Tax=Thiohalophilus sp. TaxID=3028392 RepID=UPI0028707DB4|nr:protein-disulfide reductase DsbD [Thiohalophilus sp.]MDR9437346.1 protein-disulfide reductase DsbD [Thiohalophilus sp.]